MRVLIVTHYFPPEVAVPATRLHELGRSLVARGHEVSVIAPWPHHPTGEVLPGYRGRPLVRERLDGLRVLRTWVHARPNAGAARLLDHLSFAAAALLAALLTGPADAVVSISPPIFLGAAAALISRLKHAPYFLYIGDLWVESAVEMGALRNPWVIRAASAFERLAIDAAARVLVVTRGIAARLRAIGVPDAKIELLTNAVDTDFFRPLDRDEARRRLGLGPGFLALYAGTHGMAHGLDVVLDAADQLRGRAGVRFVLAGEGADKPRLVARAGELGLSNVTFLPNQPKELMPWLLAAADACVVPLRDLPIFRGALPTKMFEAMAAARPVVLSVAGEAAEALDASGGGVAVPPDDPVALAAALTALADDPARARQLGETGREWVRENFDRKRVAARFEELLHTAAVPR